MYVTITSCATISVTRCALGDLTCIHPGDYRICDEDWVCYHRRWRRFCIVNCAINEKTSIYFDNNTLSVVMRRLGCTIYYSIITLFSPTSTDSSTTSTNSFPYIMTLFWCMFPPLQQSQLCASYQIRKFAGYACAGNAGNVFPATDFNGNRYLAIPACITARASRTCRDACRDR